MASTSTNQPAIYTPNYTNFDWLLKKAVSTSHGSKTHPETDSLDMFIVDFLGNRDVHPEKNRYDAQDISSMVAKWAKDSKSRAVELDVLKDFQADLPKPKFSPRKVQQILEKWFKLFDEVLFHGSLEGRLQVQGFVPRRQDKSTPEKSHSTFHLRERKIYINLRPRKTRLSSFRTTPVPYWLSCLLHEMLHGFFAIFFCLCESCKSKAAASKGGLGNTGHGPAWLSACRAMEIALKGLVSWESELGVKRALELEEENGTWIASFEQRREWGIRIPNSDSHPEFMQTESKPHRQVSCLQIL